MDLVPARHCSGFRLESQGMKPTFLSQSTRHVSLASAVLLMAGCAAQKKPTPAPAPQHPAPTSQCPAKYPIHHVSLAQGFSICLPANLQAGSTSGLPAGSLVFTGFPVPAGTNLTRKQLNIQPGSDDNLQNATPFGQLTAGGVTFQRMKEGDAGAGHREEHIIYAWTHAGKKLYFDFGLYSVNPAIVGPPHPAEFNEPAQVKSTEEIMRTFRRMH
jgi:hypothetical protein